MNEQYYLGLKAGSKVNKVMNNNTTSPRFLAICPNHTANLLNGENWKTEVRFSQHDPAARFIFLNTQVPFFAKSSEQ